MNDCSVLTTPHDEPFVPRLPPLHSEYWGYWQPYKPHRIPRTNGRCGIVKELGNSIQLHVLSRLSDFFLQVHLDGELTDTRESYTGSTFNTLGVQATGVNTVMLESVYLFPEEWISILEVRLCDTSPVLKRHVLFL